jgi:hypothetical protein
MSAKMVIFIIGVVFIVGSLVLALWYRINEDEFE